MALSVSIAVSAIQPPPSLGDFLGNKTAHEKAKMLCALAREHGILKLLEAECAHQDERTAPDALPKRQRTLLRQ